MVAFVDRGSAWSLGWSGSGFLAWSYGVSATLLHRSVGDSEWHPRDSGSHKAQAGDRRGVGAWAEWGSLFALWGSTGSDTSTCWTAVFGVADRGIRAGLRSVAACSRLPTAWHIRDAHAPASRITFGGALRAGAEGGLV